MHLTLFIPDLLWPDHAHHQAFEFDQAAPLARLLYLAEHHVVPLAATDSWESVLASLFGLTEKAPPLGALRFLGECECKCDCPTNSNAYDRTLLCADPVNLDFVQQSLVLSNADAADLGPDDAAKLILSLNQEFAGEGRFMMGGTPVHWYFAPSHPDVTLPNLAACSRLLGRRIDADESRQVLGRDGLRWLNRIQMCLNGHPVNEARQRIGLTAINSVWPWGTGQLNPPPHHYSAPFDQAEGNDPLLRGLCTITCTPCLTNTTTHETKNAPSITTTAQTTARLVLDTTLAAAIAQNDLQAWQQAARSLIAKHVAPALAALSRGELKQLTLIAPDAHKTQRWTLHTKHKGLRPSLLQRCMGSAHKHPALAQLIQAW